MSNESYDPRSVVDGVLYTKNCEACTLITKGPCIKGGFQRPLTNCDRCVKKGIPCVWPVHNNQSLYTKGMAVIPEDKGVVPRPGGTVSGKAKVKSKRRKDASSDDSSDDSDDGGFKEIQTSKRKHGAPLRPQAGQSSSSRGAKREADDDEDSGSDLSEAPSDGSYDPKAHKRRDEDVRPKLEGKGSGSRLDKGDSVRRHGADRFDDRDPSRSSQTGTPLHRKLDGSSPHPSSSRDRGDRDRPDRPLKTTSKLNNDSRDTVPPPSKKHKKRVVESSEEGSADEALGEGLKMEKGEGSGGPSGNLKIKLKLTTGTGGLKTESEAEGSVSKKKQRFEDDDERPSKVKREDRDAVKDGSRGRERDDDRGGERHKERNMERDKVRGREGQSQSSRTELDPAEAKKRKRSEHLDRENGSKSERSADSKSRDRSRPQPSSSGDSSSDDASQRPKKSQKLGGSSTSKDRMSALKPPRDDAATPASALGSTPGTPASAIGKPHAGTPEVNRAAKPSTPLSADGRTKIPKMPGMAQPKKTDMLQSLFQQSTKAQTGGSPVVKAKPAAKEGGAFGYLERQKQLKEREELYSRQVWLDLMASGSAIRRFECDTLNFPSRSSIYNPPSGSDPSTPFATTPYASTHLQASSSGRHLNGNGHGHASSPYAPSPNGFGGASTPGTGTVPSSANPYNGGGSLGVNPYSGGGGSVHGVPPPPTYAEQEMTAPNGVRNERSEMIVKRLLGMRDRGLLGF